MSAADALSRTPLSRLSHSLRQIGDVRERPAYIRERMELVDRIVVYTRLTRDLLLSNGIGEGKVTLSHYGIDASRLSGAREARRPSPQLRVGFVGTLAPHKGPDLLVRAFQMAPDLDARLAVHGAGAGYEPFVEELEGLSGGDPRITFCGAFAHEELERILSETDVLVVPSRWYENAPGVVFEAFAAGVPVVASGVGGISEIVRHGENGLLFGLEDAEGLARQLRRLVEEPGLLGRLRAGIGPVKTVEEYADELEEIYEMLVRGRARSG